MKKLNQKFPWHSDKTATNPENSFSVKFKDVRKNFFCSYQGVMFFIHDPYEYPSHLYKHTKLVEFSKYREYSLTPKLMITDESLRRFSPEM